MGDILVVERKYLKFFSVVYIGLLYLGMLLSIARISLKGQHLDRISKKDMTPLNPSLW